MKECKNKYDVIGMMIYWELCKEFKFYHACQLYMSILVTVLVNRKYETKVWDLKESLNPGHI